MTDPSVPDEANDASTLLDVLAEAADAGFAAQVMITDDGDLRCTKCDTTVSAADFHVEGFRRLEGASDPSDMLIVIWGSCSRCGEGGVATIGYGPNAGPADIEVLDALDLDHASDEVGAAGDAAS